MGRPGCDWPGASQRPRRFNIVRSATPSGLANRGRRIGRLQRRFAVQADCILNPVMRLRGGWKSVADGLPQPPGTSTGSTAGAPHGEIELMIPPAEFETNHWASITPQHYPVTPVPLRAGPKRPNLTKPGAIHRSTTRTPRPPTGKPHREPSTIRGTTRRGIAECRELSPSGSEGDRNE